MKRWMIKTAAVTLAATCLTACMPAGAEPTDYSDMQLIQLEEPKAGAEVAIVDTTMGTFSFVLYEEYAPKAVAHFKKLVEDGFYNQNVIYSVEKEINIFLAGATDASGETGKLVTDDGSYLETEISKDLWHFPGAISSFGTEEGVLTTTVQADSRFFAVGYSEANTDTIEQLENFGYPEKLISAYKQHGGQPIYTGQYTIFGQVYDGMDVVNDIVGVAVEEKDGVDGISPPVEEIMIETITLSTYEPTA